MDTKYYFFQCISLLCLSFIEANYYNEHPEEIPFLNLYEYSGAITAKKLDSNGRNDGVMSFEKKIEELIEKKFYNLQTTMTKELEEITGYCNKSTDKYNDIDARLEKKLSTLEYKIKELASVNMTLPQSIEELNQRLNKSDKTHKSEDLIINNMGEKLFDLKDDLIQRMERITGTNDDIYFYTKKIMDKYNNIAASDKKLEKVENELKGLTNVMQTLLQSIEKINQKLDTLEKPLGLERTKYVTTDIPTITKVVTRGRPYQPVESVTPPINPVSCLDISSSTTN